MQDAEIELIMRTMVDAVQTYDQVVEVGCGCCALFFSRQKAPLTPTVTASFPDPSAYRWSSPPKFRAVPPTGSGARPNRRTLHAAARVSGEFCRSLRNPSS
jgi:hypothetical protein